MSVIGVLRLERITVELSRTNVGNNKCILVPIKPNHILLMSIHVIHGHQIAKHRLAFTNIIPILVASGSLASKT